MSEKCVHEWYYRIVDIVSWQFFCIRCGEKLSMDKFSNHASDLEKNADALNARIAELEAAQRWIPVSERLPEDRLTLEFDAVISYTTDDPYVSVVFRDYNKSRWLEDKGGERLADVTNYVTHWRERPTLPEVQE